MMAESNKIENVFFFLKKNRRNVLSQSVQKQRSRRAPSAAPEARLPGQPPHQRDFTCAFRKSRQGD